MDYKVLFPCWYNKPYNFEIDYFLCVVFRTSKGGDIFATKY